MRASSTPAFQTVVRPRSLPNLCGRHLKVRSLRLAQHHDEAHRRLPVLVFVDRALDRLDTETVGCRGAGDIAAAMYEAAALAQSVECRHRKIGVPFVRKYGEHERA